MGLWDTITDWFASQNFGQPAPGAPPVGEWLDAHRRAMEEEYGPGMGTGPVEAWNNATGEIARRQYEAERGGLPAAGPQVNPGAIPPSGTPLDLGGGRVNAPQPPPPGGEFGNPQQMPPGVGGQIPQIPYEAPESWQFPVPNTGSIDLNAVQQAQRVADIEAATANNWGRGPSGGPPPGPMEQYLNSYDERTNSIIDEMKRADQANKLLEMGAGVFDAGIGNYTGAMGNVFKTQASYNTKPGAYEAFRGERDSGKLDDLYKIAQTRKSMQGNQPQLGAKDQLAMQFMNSPEEFRAYLGIGPQFKQKQFSDGTGAFFMDDATGEFYLPTRPDEVFNMNTPEGRRAYADAEAIAISMQPDRLKAAEKSEKERSAWETMVGFMGPEAASLLGSKPADQQRIMQLALANVYAMQQMPMPENIDVEMAWKTIFSDPELTDSDRQRLAELVRRSVGQ